MSNGETDAMDIAFLERLAQGAPLLVLMAIAVTLAIWRHMVTREMRWDEERRRREERWDEERKREQEVRERMLREVVLAVAANTETQRAHTAAITQQSSVIARLSEAIEGRPSSAGRKAGH